MSSADAKAVSPDLALVSAIRAGDASAMASLYDRYSSVVYAVALRVLGGHGSGGGHPTKVFMQLWRNPSAFDASRGNLGAWLAVITRNRAIDALRKRRPRPIPRMLCCPLFPTWRERLTGRESRRKFAEC